MIVPLAMTFCFSTLHYSLLDPDNISFVWLRKLLCPSSPIRTFASLINTLVLVVSVLFISVAAEFW